MKGRGQFTFKVGKVGRLGWFNAPGGKSIRWSSLVELHHNGSLLPPSCGRIMNKESCVDPSIPFYPWEAQADSAKISSQGKLISQSIQ